MLTHRNLKLFHPGPHTLKISNFNTKFQPGIEREEINRLYSPNSKDFNYLGFEITKFIIIFCKFFCLKFIFFILNCSILNIFKMITFTCFFINSY